MSGTKIAIKVLAWSDLSLFKAHSMRSNQRAISLNHELFIEQCESIHEPVEEPGRYGKLVENDFAIMAFEGNERPRAVTLTLVSAAEDAELHAVIAQHLELPAKHAMLKVSETFLAHLRASTTGAYPDRQHPLDAFISGDTIEDVLFGTDAPSSTGTHAPSRTGSATPKLRILTGTQAIAERLIETLNALPDRVTADSLQLAPGLFAVELQVKLQKHP